MKTYESWRGPEVVEKMKLNDSECWETEEDTGRNKENRAILKINRIYHKSAICKGRPKIGRSQIRIIKIAIGIEKWI